MSSNEDEDFDYLKELMQKQATKIGPGKHKRRINTQRSSTGTAVRNLDSSGQEECDSLAKVEMASLQGSQPSLVSSEVEDF